MVNLQAESGTVKVREKKPEINDAPIDRLPGIC